MTGYEKRITARKKAGHRNGSLFIKSRAEKKQFPPLTDDDFTTESLDGELDEIARGG